MAMSTVFEVVCWAMGLAHTPMPTLRTFYMVRTLNSYAANNGRLIPKKKTKRKPGDRRDVHRANLGTDGTFTYFSVHPNAESSSWCDHERLCWGVPLFSAPLTYEGHRTVDFQAVRYAGVEISVRNVAPGSASSK